MMLKASRGFQGREKVKEPGPCLYKKKAIKSKFYLQKEFCVVHNSIHTSIIQIFQSATKRSFFSALHFHGGMPKTLWQLTASLTHALYEWHQDITATLKQPEHRAVLTIWNTSPNFSPVLKPFPVPKSCSLTYTQTLQIMSIVKHLLQPEWPEQPWASLELLSSNLPCGFPEMLDITSAPFAFNSFPGVSHLWICVSSLATEGVQMSRLEWSSGFWMQMSGRESYPLSVWRKQS